MKSKLQIKIASVKLNLQLAESSIISSKFLVIEELLLLLLLLIN